MKTPRNRAAGVEDAAVAVLLALKALSSRSARIEALALACAAFCATDGTLRTDR